MSDQPAKTRIHTHFSLPDWRDRLLASDLKDYEKRGYEITIRWYLGFCKSSQLGACYESARHFLAKVREEKHPPANVYEKWRLALLWFFQEAKSAGIEAEFDHQPEPVEDWEKKLVTRLRIEKKAFRTEKTYRYWCRRCCRFWSPIAPADFTERHLTQFLDNLAVKQKVGASTQRQALNALVYWFRKVMEIELSDTMVYRQAPPRKSLPVVLSTSEVHGLIKLLPDSQRLMAEVQYGAGLRLNEVLRLRIKDIDFDQHCIFVRAGKGGKDRRTLLPEKLRIPLQEHLDRLKVLFEEDRGTGIAGVYLPEALSRKFPKAGEKWIWQWVCYSALRW